MWCWLISLCFCMWHATCCASMHTSTLYITLGPLPCCGHNSFNFYLLMQCIADDDEKASGSSFFSACFYYLVPCFFLFVKSHKLLGIVLKMLGSWINESSSILPCDHTHYETDISSRVEVIVSVLLLLHNDEKIGQIMSSFKAEIDCILQSIISIQVLSFHPWHNLHAWIILFKCDVLKFMYMLDTKMMGPNSELLSWYLKYLFVQSSEEISMTLQEKHKVKCAHDRLKNATSAQSV